MQDASTDAPGTSPGTAPNGRAPVGRPPVTAATDFVRATFVTEESVYGIILVSGMIVVASFDDASAFEVFWKVLATVLVFWAAHLYAGTVAHHVRDATRTVGLAAAFRVAFRRSIGLLVSAMIPSVILLLGATNAVDDDLATWSALWAGVIVLAALGWVAFARRGSTWPIRLAGALATAAFGVAMIALKALIH